MSPTSDEPNNPKKRKIEEGHLHAEAKKLRLKWYKKTKELKRQINEWRQAKKNGAIDRVIDNISSQVFKGLQEQFAKQWDDKCSKLQDIVGVDLKKNITDSAAEMDKCEVEIEKTMIQEAELDKLEVKFAAFKESKLKLMKVVNVQLTTIENQMKSIRDALQRDHDMNMTLIKTAEDKCIDGIDSLKNELKDLVKLKSPEVLGILLEGFYEAKEEAKNESKEKRNESL